MSGGERDYGAALGAAICRLRKLRDMSQGTLIEGTGLSQSTLSRIECGTASARLWDVRAIAQALGVGLAELVQEVEVELERKAVVAAALAEFEKTKELPHELRSRFD